jgi:hypothetical protein
LPPPTTATREAPHSCASGGPAAFQNYKMVPIEQIMPAQAVPGVTQWFVETVCATNAGARETLARPDRCLAFDLPAKPGAADPIDARFPVLGQLLQLAGFDVDGVKRHRNARGPAGFETRAFARRGPGRRARSTGSRSVLVVAAGENCFVGVERKSIARAQLGVFRNFAGGTRVDISSENGVALQIENLVSLAADDDFAGAAFDDRLNLAGFQIDSRDALARRDH